MGMYDEFCFDKDFKSLPEGIPKDGWQTKDMECGLYTFRVLADGRVVRSGGWTESENKHKHYFSDQLSGRFGIYTGEHELTLRIQEGFVTEVIDGIYRPTIYGLEWVPIDIE